MIFYPGLSGKNFTFELPSVREGVREGCNRNISDNDYFRAKTKACEEIMQRMNELHFKGILKNI